MAISVLNTDAGLSGKTLVILEDAQTITGLKTFNRSTNAPFAVNSGAAVVTNLDADKLDGSEGSEYAKLADAETVAGAWTFSSDLTMGGGDLIASANLTIRRDTSDASDSGVNKLVGGGADGASRGAGFEAYGNEHATLAGRAIVNLGNVAGAEFVVQNDGGDILAIQEDTGEGLWTATPSIDGTPVLDIRHGSSTDSTDNRVLSVRSAVAASSTSSRLIQFYSATTTIAGQIRLNNNAVAYDTTSDERLKDFIGPTRYGLDAVLAMDVRDYTWKADEGRMLRTGLSAQQLHEVFPEAVSVGGDVERAPWGIDYGKLTPPLIAAVQTLAARLSALETA